MNIIRRRATGGGIGAFVSIDSLVLLIAVPTNRLEMEVEAGCDHMAVVVEAFISDVLVSRFNLFQPNVTIGAVDRDVVADEELEPSPGMDTESILRVVEIAWSFDRGVVPPSPAEQKGGQASVAQRIDQCRDLHGVGVRPRALCILSPIVGGPFERQISKRIDSDLRATEPPRLSFLRRSEEHTLNSSHG